MTQRTVGLIGLGFMGRAFAQRLLAAGCNVIGTDVDPARLAEFSSLGGAAVPSAIEVAIRCDQIVLAVYDATQVIDIIDQVAGVERENLPHDLMMICTTTCTPAEVSMIASRTSRHGIALVESPVSGTSEQALSGKGVALVAGQSEAIATAEDVLKILCPERFIIGTNTGDAARAKLAVNLVLQLNRAALAEGLVFAQSLGLDAMAFLGVLRGSAASSQVMATKGAKMVRGDFTAESRIAQTMKDAHLIIDAARDAGLHLPLMDVNANLLALSIARGGPDRDSSAVIDAIKPYHQTWVTEERA